MRGARRVFIPGPKSWLLTFADVTTLLMVFFVLIFSVSRLDADKAREISSAFRNTARQAPPVPENIRRAVELLRGEGGVAQHENRIKELLFPVELLPPHLDKGTLAQSIRVLPLQEGMVFALKSSLLFESGSSRLLPQGQALLESLALLFAHMPGEVSISGHESRDALAGPGESQAQGQSQSQGQTPDEPALERDTYLVSARYALAVLGVFLRQGEAPSRFGVSAYGPDRPLFLPEGGPEFGARVEILLKTGVAIP